MHVRGWCARPAQQGLGLPQRMHLEVGLSPSKDPMRTVLLRFYYQEGLVWGQHSNVRRQYISTGAAFP